MPLGKAPLGKTLIPTWQSTEVSFNNNLRELPVKILGESILSDSEPEKTELFNPEQNNFQVPF